MADIVTGSDDPAKTAMWRINQLSRYHGIKHEYKLEKEESQAKAKQFTMVLTLGRDVWNGVGSTKKQAQQNAAQNALDNTTLTFPPENKKKCANQNALTSTVKLNSFAMAHGMQVTYKLISGNQSYRPFYYNPHTYRNWNTFSHSNNGGSIPYNPCADIFSGYRSTSDLIDFYHTPSHPVYNKKTRFSVCATVGGKDYFGEGPTEQAARHNAADKVLATLMNESDQSNFKETSVLTKSDSNKNDNYVTEKQQKKSPISLLYEEAVPRGMSVVFKTTKETGAPHLRFYTLELTVGYFSNGKLDEEKVNFQAEGCGMSKKTAKLHASTAVLEKMKCLPPLKKKPTKPNNSFSNPFSKQVFLLETLHPVSRLVQISQARKVTAPSYSLIGQENKKPNVNRFAYKCTFEDKSAIGYGRSKKDAKRAAANEMLNELGYQPTPSKVVPNLNVNPTKTSLKIKTGNKDVDQSASRLLQVKFADEAS